MRELSNGMQWDENPDSLKGLNTETTLEIAELHPDLRDVLVDNINTAKAAYLWVYKFNTHKDQLIGLMSEQQHWACEWALNIGDQDIMRDRIKSEHYSIFWASQFGDVQHMRKNIKSDYYKKLWDTIVKQYPFYPADQETEALNQKEVDQSEKFGIIVVLAVIAFTLGVMVGNYWLSNYL